MFIKILARKRLLAFCFFLYGLNIQFTWAAGSSSTYLRSSITVGDFSKQSSSAILKQWRPLIFKGIDKQTTYRLEVDDRGVQVVHAHASASASGWVRKMNVDLEQYPVVQWSWKVSSVLAKGDMHTKAGDDYPARLYLLFDYDPEKASWIEKMARSAASLFYGDEPPGSSLNYIWSSIYPVNSHANNAYTDKAKMWAVEGGKKNVGKWRFYSRNVLADYRLLFGYSPPRLVGIAIMSDTDNTLEEVDAWFGDIRFSML